MADNSFTKTYQDGLALTETELDTAFKSVQPDISNLTQTTNGSTSGQFLQSNGSGIAPSFASVPDPVGPTNLRNYALAASASSGTLRIALKTKAGTDPSPTDVVNMSFNNDAGSTASYTEVNTTAARSFVVSASASLGYVNTSAHRIYVYAINNAGTARLAVSARSDLDDGVARLTVAMSSGADLGSAIYASAALTVVARLLGSIKSAHTAGGLWQTPTALAIGSITAPFTGAIGTNPRTISDFAGVGDVAQSIALTPESKSSTPTFVNIPNMTITLQTTGRPVEVFLSGGGGFLMVNNNTVVDTVAMEAQFTRDGVAVYTVPWSDLIAVAGRQSIPASMRFLDQPAAGSYIYRLQIRKTNGNAISEVGFTAGIKLCAYEI